MGVKKLQIKEYLHYRKGPTWGNCSQCNQYIYAVEPRCNLIGDKPGRLYKINPQNICDKFDNSEKIKKFIERLKEKYEK